MAAIRKKVPRFVMVPKLVMVPNFRIVPRFVKWIRKNFQRVSNIRKDSENVSKLLRNWFRKMSEMVRKKLSR